MCEMKNILYGDLSNKRLDKTEKKIGKLQDITIGAIQNETQIEIKTGKRINKASVNHGANSYGQIQCIWHP